MQQAFEEYLLYARPEVAIDVLDAFLTRLLRIYDWFERQSILHFYASSVLLVYEGHSKQPPIVDIRMIDFSHVFSTDADSAGSNNTIINHRDENYLYGLIRIIGIFQKIRTDLLKRMNNC